MPSKPPDIGNNDTSEPGEQGDTIIEIVDGVPYIYEKGPVNEAEMERRRGN